MFKKITALVLVMVLLVSCFGCTGGSRVKLKSDFKIALITGSKELYPDTYAKAMELKAIHGDNLIVKEFPDDYLLDNESVARVSFKTAEDQNVKAIIFANAVEGTGTAIGKIRVNRGDIFIAACGSVEDLKLMADRTDIILNLDSDAIADAMIKTSAELGAKNFVYYTFNRHTKYAFVESMRKTAGDAAKARNMGYVEVASVDLFDPGRTLDNAKSYISEDAARKQAEFGADFAMYCTDPYVQEKLVTEALYYKAVLAIPASPFCLARALDVDLTGHETDNKYALEQAAQRLDKTGNAKRMASWTFSSDMLLLETAFEYAYLYCGAKNKDSIDAAKELNGIAAGLNEGASFTVNAENEKVYLLDGAFHKF
ncbi:MAG: DUF3798 domain-containing protein [Oscillospiraceae bacterium]|nr:DUF3798 domain-containing protein [Oscillospiraceae bacterium]